MIDLAVEKSAEVQIERPAKPKENLKQRAYLNSLTSIIDFAAVQITGLLVSPVIVRGLGPAFYGAWKIIGQLTGYATVADSRATQVLKWTVARKKDIASEEELRSDVTSAFFVTAFILPVILIAGAILSWYAPYITRIDIKHYRLIRITCSLLLFSLVIAKVFDLFEAVLRGMNLGFKRMGLRSGIIIIGGTLKVFVITQGHGLVGLALVQIFITIVTGLSYYFIVKKSVGWFGFGKTNFAKVLSFCRLSGWNMANTATDTILTSSDKVLLGFAAGPVLVSSYALSTFLPLAIQGLLFRVIIGAIPGIGKLFGLKEYSKIYKVRDTMTGLIFLLITATGVTIILFNESFLKAWVGDGFFAGDFINLLLIVMILQDTLIKHDGYIINATLDLKKKVYLSLISSSIFIALGLVFTAKWGIIGLCSSLICGKFLLFIGQRKFLKSKIKHDVELSFIQRVRPLITSVLMLSSALYITTFFQPVRLIWMIALALVSFVISFSIFYLVGLRHEQKEALLKIISSIKFFKTN
ncbi:lipopolysaccharide biosynthesis protein [Flavitalea sp.]|nr:lipopolysaccharide biosynthesis protein [Flavitalea sp.]